MYMLLSSGYNQAYLLWMCKMEWGEKTTKNSKRSDKFWKYSEQNARKRTYLGNSNDQKNVEFKMPWKLKEEEVGKKIY